MNVPKMIIYLIRDERSERYGTPIFTQLDADSLAESYRASIFANLKDAAPFLDSVLYQVGEYDTVTGEITEVAKQDYKLVCRLGDFVKESLAKARQYGEQNHGN